MKGEEAVGGGGGGRGTGMRVTSLLRGPDLGRPVYQVRGCVKEGGWGGGGRDRGVEGE